MHSRLVPFLVSGLLAALAAAPVLGAGGRQDPPRFDGHKVVRVELNTQRDLLTMLAISEDHWTESVGLGTMDFRVPPDGLGAMDEAGIGYQVWIEDVQALIDAERARIAAGAEGAGLRGGEEWFSEYKDYDQISLFVDGLAVQHPDLAERFLVGQSLEGRDIFGLRITGTGGGGGEKPAILLNSLQHAREWITPMTTMFIADRLLNTYGSDPRATALMDHFEFIIVPVSNPDGYAFTWSTNRLWRKNRRDNGDGSFGVDLNRNWGHQWGGVGSSGNTQSETYRGPAAFSEPCTTVLSDFIAADPSILLHIDVHSFGQLVLEQWGHTFELPSDSTTYGLLSEGMAQTFFDQSGSLYAYGQGYRAIYPTSGTMPSWTYGVRDALGFTIELRDTGQQFGFILPPDQIVPTGEETCAAILGAAEWLMQRDVAFSFPHSAPEFLQAEDRNTFYVQVSRGLGDVAPGTARLFSRAGDDGPFTESFLNPVGGIGDTLFTATLQGGPCGSTVEYYFQAQTTAGALVTYPAGGSDAPLTAVSREVTVIFSDDFEVERGWALGSPQDDALSGHWTRSDPNGTTSQPEYDHSPEGAGACSYTGSNPRGNAGNGDVDGGRTTLNSPTFNLANHPDATVSYDGWYCNRRGASPSDDVLLVEVSNDAGATWILAQTIGPGGAESVGGWRPHTFRIADFVPPTAAVKVRFIASDEGNDSTVEAAIDDFRVVAASCPAPPCPPDWNADGILDSNDYFAFLTDFFGEGGADFNDDGVTTSDDFFAFLTAYFEGC